MGPGVGSLSVPRRIRTCPAVGKAARISAATRLQEIVGVEAFGGRALAMDMDPSLAVFMVMKRDGSTPCPVTYFEGGLHMEVVMIHLLPPNKTDDKPIKEASVRSPFGGYIFGTTFP
jgi:hypothetical protein